MGAFTFCGTGANQISAPLQKRKACFRTGKTELVLKCVRKYFVTNPSGAEERELGNAVANCR